MTGPDYFVILAAFVLFCDMMPRAVTGRGAMFWAIAGAIACYAFALTLQRCTRFGGWRWLRDRYETELSVTRSLFMTVPQMRPPQQGKFRT